MTRCDKTVSLKIELMQNDKFAKSVIRRLRYYPLSHAAAWQNPMQTYVNETLPSFVI